MSNKALKIVGLALLSVALLLLATNLNIASVKAQTTDTVNILPSGGGTTTPDSGTSSYADGTSVALQANPAGGYIFSNWQISTTAGGASTYSDNPYTLTVNGNTTYTVQAVFTVIQTPPNLLPVLPGNLSSAAIVVILPAVGGYTTPAAGTYGLANAASFNIMAVPDSGWTFAHWVIGGVSGISTTVNHGGYAFTDTPTNNPYNVNHGYGYTYSYQPVFSPTNSSTTPTPSPTVGEFSAASAAIIAAILIVAGFGTYAYARRTKK